MALTELIEALTILRKYGDPACPTHCEHDVLCIVGIEPDDVPEEDRKLLDEKGFFVGNEWGDDMFMSFRYGSA